jgi:hypothetical protein
MVNPEMNNLVKDLKVESDFCLVVAGKGEYSTIAFETRNLNHIDYIAHTMSTGMSPEGFDVLLDKLMEYKLQRELEL